MDTQELITLEKILLQKKNLKFIKLEIKEGEIELGVRKEFC
jgi:hypothetical protein